MWKVLRLTIIHCAMRSLSSCARGCVVRTAVEKMMVASVWRSPLPFSEMQQASRHERRYSHANVNEEPPEDGHGGNRVVDHHG